MKTTITSCAYILTYLGVEKQYANEYIQKTKINTET